MTTTATEPVLVAPVASRRRVLMLTHRLPYPPDRGDRIRSYHMLKMLSKHFDVGLACTSEDPVWLQHHELLRTMAQRVVIQPVTNKGIKTRAVLALAGGNPITPAAYYRQGLADAIQQWHEQQPFDAVLTFCTGMIQYSRLIYNPRTKRTRELLDSGYRPQHVLDLVDVDSAKWESYTEASVPPMSWIYGAEARRLRRIEAGQFDHFDAITVVSHSEAQAYRDHVGEHPGLTVVHNGVDLQYFSPMSDNDSKTMVFVGVLNYKPNEQGIIWFVKNVMPALLQKMPEAKLLVVGRHPTNKVLELGKQPGVEIVGSVPDVRTYIEQASVAIAPLRIARGVQNKVLEAMSCARTVVCSHGAANGIDAEENKHLLKADTPEQWVEQLARVLNDAGMRQRIGQAARQRVEEEYSWDRCMKPMVDLLAQSTSHR